jgi:hypothetical protein
MSADYRDARLKIDRAKKHIADFTCAHIALENSYTSTIEDCSYGGQAVIHEIPNLRNALDDMSLIAGDAIHNLRSALDFAWYSTILRLLPDKITDKTNFPVRETRESLHAALHGIEVDIRLPSLYEFILNTIQPYKGGHNEIVWTLHQLDISDKHILVLHLDPIGGVNGISVRDANGELILGNSMAARCSDGRFMISFPKGFTIEDKGKMSFAVTLEEAGIFECVPAEGFLSNLNNFTLYTVQLLENFT